MAPLLVWWSQLSMSADYIMTKRLMDQKSLRNTPDEWPIALFQGVSKKNLEKYFNLCFFCCLAFSLIQSLYIYYMFVFNQCGFKLHKSLVKRIKAADRAAAAEATLNCDKGGVLPGDEGDGRAIHYPLTLYKLSHTNAAPNPLHRSTCSDFQLSLLW